MSSTFLHAQPAHQARYGLDSHCGPGGHSPSPANPWWRRTILRGLGRIFAPRWQVSGRENLPHGPYVLVANHLSHCDAWYLSAALDRPVRFMAMSEIFRSPLPAFLMRLCGAFPVSRGTADRGALGLAAQILQQGQILGIFPEGYLSRDGNLGPLKAGAVQLALQTGVPLVPVGLHGTDGVMPYGPTCPRPSWKPLRMHIGQPIPLEDLASLPPREARRQGLLLLTGALRSCVLQAQGGAELTGPAAVQNGAAAPSGSAAAVQKAANAKAGASS